MTLEELKAQRDVLLAARYAGIRTVEIDGRRVTYAAVISAGGMVPIGVATIAAGNGVTVARVRLDGGAREAM
jgi:hypothetical protein